MSDNINRFIRRPLSKLALKAFKLLIERKKDDIHYLMEVELKLKTKVNKGTDSEEAHKYVIFLIVEYINKYIEQGGTYE